MRIHAIKHSSLLIKFAFTAVLLLMPAAVPAQEKIAFESQRDGNHEIYIMNADGTNQLRLTFNTVFDADAAFSPGGEKIAFMSTRDGNAEIYIMNADGSSQTRLTNSPGHDAEPAFSPDGSKIAFISTRSGHLAIWIMNVDGSNPFELMDGFGGREPAFTPDGTKIVFCGTGGSSAISQIWIMNADGTGRDNLSQDFNSDDTSPAISPDGTKIVYFRDPHGPGSTTPEITMMNIDGSNKVSVTNSNGKDTRPSFSVDGTRIVFTSVRDGNSEIYTMNFDGTDPINLTNHTGSDLAPVWGAANSAPVLSNVVVSSPINEGGVATLTGQITDANAGNSFTLNITWGDGQSQTLNYPAGTTSFEVTHVYVAAGNYTITVQVTDNYGGMTVETVSVIVTTSPPAAPTGFRVQSVSVNRVELAWTDASNNEDGFAIERCSGKRACNNFVEIARVGANTTSYADTTVLGNTQYFYRMRAFNTGGVSSYTNVVSAKTPRK